MTKLIPYRNMMLTNVGNVYNMIDDFFNESPRNLNNATFRIDIEKKEDSYLIEAELPGISKEDIDLQWDEGKLTIKVTHDEETTEETPAKNYVHKERRHTSMERSMYLGEIQEDNISAKLENGILTIETPFKKKVDITKKINID